MKNIAPLVLIIIMVSAVSAELSAMQTAEKHWKAGTAATDITPAESMWMAGYASRTSPSEGKLHNLYAKALAIEDASGHKAVLVTADLLGLPKGISDHIRNNLKEQFHLSKAQIILNSSHTHSGPVLRDALSPIYDLDETEFKKVEAYSAWLEEKITAVAAKALKSMQPVKLYSNIGVTRFQVNRRNNKANTLHLQTDLNGPNDYSVPVLKVVDQKGSLQAVVFGYSCHNTVLSLNKWSGDYAGFAQIELEKMYPGTAAMFFQGAGGDQNPLPRHTVPLAVQYGKTLAAAVERVLAEDMHELKPQLSYAYSEIDLKLQESPSKESLAKIAEVQSGYERRWAQQQLDRLNSGRPLLKTYPYPVQIWKLGNQALVSLGGEVVIEYQIKIKELLGPDVFVLGYSNDVMAYIPSIKILREGGYEGYTSQHVYGMPEKWDESIEPAILKTVADLSKQLGLKVKEE